MRSDTSRKTKREDRGRRRCGLSQGSGLEVEVGRGRGERRKVPKLTVSWLV